MAEAGIVCLRNAEIFVGSGAVAEGFVEVILAFDADTKHIFRLNLETLDIPHCLRAY